MKVIFITGTPGAGKSTIASELCKKIEKSAHVQVDYFRKMIMSGYASPHNWNQEADRQYALARKNAAMTAKNIAESGFTVIIDDIIRMKWVDEWKSYLNGCGIKFVLLNPDLQTAKNRNTDRDIWTVGEEIIEYLHKHLSEENTKGNGWYVVDNTNQTVQETVGEVLTIIK